MINFFTRIKEFKKFSQVVGSFPQQSLDEKSGEQGRILLEILDGVIKLLFNIEKRNSEEKHFEASLLLLKTLEKAKNLDPESFKELVRILNYTKEMSAVVIGEKIKREWLTSQNNIETDSSGKAKALLQTLSALVSYYNSTTNKLYTPYSRLTQFIDIINSCDSTELSEIEQLLKDPNQSTSFSQEGEDIVLSKLLELDNIGFYVDVGAHHPFRFSNTYKFYKMGWRGINIDPVPGFEELFSVHRPRDINLNIGVTSPEFKGDLTYYSFQEPAFNSFNPEKMEDVKHKLGGQLVNTFKIPCLTLDQILETNLIKGQVIDFINIDVELYERQVLEGFSIDRWRPKCIVIEDKDFNISDPNKSWIYSYFVKNNYSLRSSLFRSMIYCRNS